MNFRCSRSSLDNYILLYYRRLAIKVYLHKRTFDIELSVLFLCLKTGGVKMEGTVTLSLAEYNNLYDKAKWYEQNNECDTMDTPEPEDEINTKITLDVIEFENMCKEIEELKEMNEYLKMRLSNAEYLYEYKVKNEEGKHIGLIEKTINLHTTLEFTKDAINQMREEVKEFERLRKNIEK